MDALDVISKIEAERKQHVIVRYSPKGLVLPTSSLTVEKECWEFTITNEPEQFHNEMKEKFKRWATHHSTIEVDSVEEAVHICEGLYQRFNNEMSEPIIPEVDANQKVFIAIHIHYHVN